MMLYFQLTVNLFMLIFLSNFKKKLKIERIHAKFRTTYSSSAKLNSRQNNFSLTICIMKSFIQIQILPSFWKFEFLTLIITEYNITLVNVR